MSKGKKQLLGTLITGCLLIALPVAAAERPEQETGQEFSLDEYVVTASRVAVRTAETAASVTVVTQEEIAREGLTSIPEILQKTNVSVEIGNTDSMVTINGDDRVLIMVDGRRMNWDQTIGIGRSGVDLNAQLPNVRDIERVEIVRGPASSLYGSDAAGGVINIITRKAAGTDIVFSADHGNWGLQRYNLSVGDTVNGLGYRITAERKRQDYFEYKEAGTGQTKRMPNSAYERDRISLRLDQELNSGDSVSFYTDYTDAKFGYALAAPGFSHQPNAYKDYRDYSMDLTYRWRRSSGESWLKVYQNYVDFDIYHFMEKPAMGYPGFTRSVTNRANGVSWQQNWQLGERHMLVGGAEWRQTHFDIPTDTIDEKLSNRAVFLEDRWKLPADWTITLGARYDEHSNFGGKSTTRVTFNREVNRTTNVFASWGQVFKAPLMEEMYGSLGLIAGDPNIRPESGETVTAGINTRLKNGMKLQANIFSSHIDDAIVMVPDGMMYRYKNLNEQKRRGGEVSLSHQLSPQWQVSAAYTYVKKENKEGTGSFVEDPDNSQPSGYRLGIGYRQDGWDAGLSLRGASGRSLSSYTDKSYWVMDLMVNRQLSETARAYVKVYNLTNEAYELSGYLMHGAGAFPMPGRNFYFGVEKRI